MTWTRICGVDDLDDEEGLRADLSDRGCPVLALFKVDEEVFALDDLCSHDESSLAEGYVDGDVVECAWHFAKFSMRTGEVLAPPATRPVRAWAARIEGDDVLVELPDLPA